MLGHLQASFILFIVESRADNRARYIVLNVVPDGIGNEWTNGILKAWIFASVPEIGPRFGPRTQDQQG
jgi:hypothetical protein